MRAAIVLTLAPPDRKRAPLVAAQDAACPRPQDVVTDTTPYGVVCLSMAAPPVDEIGAVWRQVDGIGRSALIPDAFGPTMRRNRLLPVLKIIARTVVLLRWCGGAVVWEPFLSRPWRYGLGLVAGVAPRGPCMELAARRFRCGPRFRGVGFRRPSGGRMSVCHWKVEQEPT